MKILKRKRLEEDIWDVLLTSNINAEENEAKKLCDAKIQKEHPQRSVLEEQCAVIAKESEKKKEYSIASWYYLLDNKYEHNTQY